MKKVSKVSSKYTLTKAEAEKMLNQPAIDHIIRLSAADIIRTMPIEDLKKIFTVELKEPIQVIEGESVLQYEVVVSIEIEG